MRRSSLQNTLAVPDLLVSPTSDGTVPSFDFSFGKYDSRGLPHLLNGNVVATAVIDIRESVFKRPNQEYLGYAADGYFYAYGAPQPQLEQFEASWSAESPGPYRGTKTSFPDLAYVVVTTAEVAIFDAETGDLWMRFLSTSGGPLGLGTAVGAPVTFQVTDVAFIDGWLILATGNFGATLIDFSSDGAYVALPSGLVRFTATLSARNQVTFRSNGSSVSGDYRRIFHAACLGVSVGRAATSTGKYAPAAILRHPGGMTAVELRYQGSTSPKMYRHNFCARVGDALDPEMFQVGSPVRSDPPVDYLEANVQVGMYFIKEVAYTCQVTAVTSEEFTLDGAWAKRELSDPIYVGWAVTDATIHDGKSIAAFGHNYVLQIPWNLHEGNDTPLEDAGDSVPAFEDEVFPEGSFVALMPASVGAIRALVGAPGGVYVATDVGIVLVRGNDAEVLYGAGAGRYPILPGSDCQKVILDVDTQRLNVLMYDGDDSLILDIAQEEHRLVRTTRVSGRIRTLTSFRGA